MDNNNKTKTDDELLMQFFSEVRTDIPDEGFSRQVMRRLPRRARCLDRIWTAVCFSIGLTLFFLLDGVASLRMLVYNTMGNMAGYVSSIDLGCLSPITIAASLFTIAVVWGYNVLATQR